MGITGCKSQQKEKSDLKTQIENGAFLVDVRAVEEFKRGSAEGAINIPMDEVSNRLSEFEGKENIIVFCRSGARSGRIKNFLTEQGFTNVTNAGGLEDVLKIMKKKE